MSLFRRQPVHEHVWEDCGDYDHHPPGSFSYEFDGLTLKNDTQGLIRAEMQRRERTRQQYTKGFTLFHQRCSVCGEVRAREVLGKFDGGREPK